MSREKSEPQKSVSVGLCVLSVSLMAVLWIVFVGGTRRDEMIVAVQRPSQE